MVIHYEKTPSEFRYVLLLSASWVLGLSGVVFYTPVMADVAQDFMVSELPTQTVTPISIVIICMGFAGILARQVLGQGSYVADQAKPPVS